jgi:hypothetical protein
MLSESDINLLDSYLDDALSASEVQSLDARLTEEPELASSLDSLRAERKARAAVLMTLTPSAQDAGQFSDTVIKSVRRREQTRWWMRNIRIGVSVAACLVIGFSVGWVGRGHGPIIQQVAKPLTPPNQEGGQAQRVIDVPKAPQTGQYQVALLDEKGKVIATHRFNKIEEVKRFADDLAQSQTRPHQAPPAIVTPGPKFSEPGPSHKMRYSEPGPAPTRPTVPSATQPTNSAAPQSTQPSKSN